MADAPAPPQMASPKLTTMMIFILAMFIMFDQNLRNMLGRLVGTVLQPIIGFDYQYPMLTLVLAGLIMVSFSIIVRSLFTDYVDMARSQKVMSEFNKELRQARQDNNLYKIKKLTEHQQEIMSKSMEMSTKQLKLMPATLLFIIPIFAWVFLFVDNLPSAIISVPWQPVVNLKDSNVLPNWILVYTLVSIPFGHVLTRTIRFFQFKKKLDEMDDPENGNEAL